MRVFITLADNGKDFFSIYLNERRKHFSEGDVFFQNAPSFHIAGLTFMSCYLHTKKTMVLYTPTSVVPYLLKAKQYKVGSIFLKKNRSNSL